MQVDLEAMQETVLGEDSAQHLALDRLQKALETNLGEARTLRAEVEARVQNQFAALAKALKGGSVDREGPLPGAAAEKLVSSSRDEHQSLSRSEKQSAARVTEFAMEPALYTTITQAEFERFKRQTNENMKNLDAKVKKGTDLSKVTAVLAGFEKQLQRNIAQSRTLSQEHVEYVQKLVVKGAEQQVGQDSWAAIKLLEV